jgi:hypothetical protein
MGPIGRLTNLSRYTAAFACRTLEFWIIDTIARTVQVFYPAKKECFYGVDESVPVEVLAGASLLSRSFLKAEEILSRSPQN